MEKIKTKEYAIDDDLVINKITVNYCTESDIDDSDNELELSITHQGAGFYYIMKTERFAFDDIDFMIRILKKKQILRIIHRGTLMSLTKQVKNEKRIINYY
jgi:hypothetical protein